MRSVCSKSLALVAQHSSPTAVLLSKNAISSVSRVAAASNAVRCVHATSALQVAQRLNEKGGDQQNEKGMSITLFGLLCTAQHACLCELESAANLSLVALLPLLGPHPSHPTFSGQGSSS